jgi:hypothetical protein
MKGHQSSDEAMETVSKSHFHGAWGVIQPILT